MLAICILVKSCIDLYQYTKQPSSGIYYLTDGNGYARIKVYCEFRNDESGIMFLSDDIWDAPHLNLNTILHGIDQTKAIFR